MGGAQIVVTHVFMFVSLVAIAMIWLASQDKK